MKRIALIFAVSISMLACNQSQKDEDTSKKIGNIDTVSTNTLKPDTTTIKTSIPKPDTTTVKTINTVSPESLQNFWVLESVDGKLLNPNDFPNGMPYFELNLAKNKVSGYAGCNGMNGSIKVQGKNIIFGKLITTKSTCSVQDFENSYLDGLSGHKVPYTIEGTKLYLTVEPKRIFIYRKIQQ